MYDVIELPYISLTAFFLHSDKFTITPPFKSFHNIVWKKIY